MLGFLGGIGFALSAIFKGYKSQAKNEEMRYKAETNGKDYYVDNKGMMRLSGSDIPIMTRGNKYVDFKGRVVGEFFTFDEEKKIKKNIEIIEYNNWYCEEVLPHVGTYLTISTSPGLWSEKYQNIFNQYRKYDKKYEHTTDKLTDRNMVRITTSEGFGGWLAFRETNNSKKPSDWTYRIVRKDEYRLAREYNEYEKHRNVVQKYISFIKNHYDIIKNAYDVFGGADYYFAKFPWASRPWTSKGRVQCHDKSYYEKTNEIIKMIRGLKSVKDVYKIKRSDIDFIAKNLLSQRYTYFSGYTRDDIIKTFGVDKYEKQNGFKSGDLGFKTESSLYEDNVWKHKEYCEIMRHMYNRGINFDINPKTLNFELDNVLSDLLYRFRVMDEFYYRCFAGSMAVPSSVKFAKDWERKEDNHGWNRKNGNR